MAPEPLLAHNVYFTLKEPAPAARQRLLEACRHFLTGHPGTILFVAGTLAEALIRPVNDRDFDVALHIVFQNQAAHDAYQESPRHLQFIRDNQAGWARVRVFDSLVARS